MVKVKEVLESRLVHLHKDFIYLISSDIKCETAKLAKAPNNSYQKGNTQGNTIDLKCYVVIYIFCWDFSPLSLSPDL